METTKIDVAYLKTIPLPDYADDANKSDYGKLLLIAGSRRLPGAAILAARAALRAGCGTVRAALPESIALAVGAAVPELMVLPLPETSAGTLAKSALQFLQEQYELCDAVVIGPGLDDNEETAQLCREIVGACPLPMVVDAAALDAFDKKFDYPAPRILTPHSGEMNGISPKDAGGQVTLVSKGRETIISGEAVLLRNEAGTRGLGTAGSGDVLSGIIGGFLAQGIEPTIAAAWGVHLHALAGEAAEKDLGDDGIMASDLIARAPGVLRYLRRQVAPPQIKAEDRAGLRTGLRP